MSEGYLLTRFASSSPQEVFNQNFDSALQSLVCDFLTRMEQLFPVPDFKQVPKSEPKVTRGLEGRWGHNGF